MWMALLLSAIFYQHLFLGIESSNAQEMEGGSGDHSLSPELPKSDCIKYPNTTILAYVGWPFVPSCDHIVDRLRDYNDSIYGTNWKKNSTCKLFFSNGTLAGAITNIPRTFRTNNIEYYFNKFPSIIVQDGMNENFTMEFAILNANFCASMDLYLEPQADPISGEECQNLQTQAIRLNRSADVGEREILSCTALHELPQLYFPVEDASFEWWYNCNQTMPNNTAPKQDKLFISSTAFFNPGEYLCAVKYNGKRRFLLKHNVCVQYRSSAIFSIKCQDVKAKLGADVNVTCFVDAGTGNDESRGLFAYSLWLNDTTANATEVCNASPKNPFEKLFATKSDRRVTCDITPESTTQQCYEKVISSSKVKASFQTFRINLEIKNLQVRDAGQYHMLFQTFNNDFQNSTVTVTISMVETLNRNVLIIALTLSILFVIMMLVIVCFWKRIHILWFCKKHCGSCEADDKPYVAYLAYHYNRERMKERSKNFTENLISSLQEFMQSIGAKTFDDHQDNNEFQLHLENISKVQKECHRIIIILNEEYVTDQWDLHKAYLAIRNMAIEGAKLIFIPLPGVKKIFKQLPDEPKTALIHAMKINTTINWDGKLPLSAAFKHHLQYSLPKLKKNRIPVEVVANPYVQEDQV